MWKRLLATISSVSGAITAVGTLSGSIAELWRLAQVENAHELDWTITVGLWKSIVSGVAVASVVALAYGTFSLLRRRARAEEARRAEEMSEYKRRELKAEHEAKRTVLSHVADYLDHFGRPGGESYSLCQIAERQLRQLEVLPTHVRNSGEIYEYLQRLSPFIDRYGVEEGCRQMGESGDPSRGLVGGRG